MADKRPYSKLDVGYLSNPKIAALLDDNPRAVLLHLACINYGVQHATDGIVPLRIAMRIACATQCDADLLMQCGLLLDANGGNVEVRDFLEHQRSSAEVKARSQAAMLAASSRWDAKRTANGNANRIANGNAEKERKKEIYQTTAARFDEFWSAYPRRVGKGQAEKAWAKAAAIADPGAIIAAAVTYAKSRASEDPKFTKHPATWLNGKCWEDEAPTPLATGPRFITSKTGIHREVTW